MLVRSVLAALALAAPLAAQIRVGCTPDSMAAARAGSLAAAELGRWRCYALNVGPTQANLSATAFALGFMELHQVSAADAADIFGMKQAKTKKAVAARVLKYGLVGAAIVTSGGWISVTPAIAGWLGLAATGASQVQQQLEKEVPTTSNALAGMWGPNEVVALAPGQGFQWKVYASKIKGAAALGPRTL
jgi:hypothetical protein